MMEVSLDGGMLETAPSNVGAVGTVLMAAFVDPAYEWPPSDGGKDKNSVELKASSALLSSVKDDATNAGAGDDEKDGNDNNQSVKTFNTPKHEPTHKTATKARTSVIEVEETTKSRGIFGCCQSKEAVVTDAHSRSAPSSSDEAAPLTKSTEKTEEEIENERKEQKRQADIVRNEKKKSEREKVPEGVLLYKLDTADHTIELVSDPWMKTDVDKLLSRMVVAEAQPSFDKSRRGILLTGIDGTRTTLVACEQRTATAWLEAIDMMLGNKARQHADIDRVVVKQESRAWGAERLNTSQRDEIEDQYMNLAAYSNNLIRAGALPNRKKGGGGAGGIFYSVTSQKDAGEDLTEDQLESIAKRRAVIKDSWDFYRMICSLMRDKRKYDEAFRKMQLDPVFPYLNSMTGLNDPGDAGTLSAEKSVMQTDLPEYSAMTRTQVCEDLVKRASEAQSSLVEICKALAGSLGMEEVGVGPVKEVGAAIRKAEKKYAGDVLKVTDYCRALLVVKDFPTLLALLELARDSFGPLIRRVKLSNLKQDHKSLPGGYRDCKINVELKEHICEIQVHLWPMWVVCGVDGFRHYRHCLEYSTDDFTDPYEALEGLDRKTVAELIVMSEEAVADMPLEKLEWYHEKYILDYFAEVGLFMRHGLYEWAEVTLRALIKLRIQSPDIGINHHETLLLEKHLEKVLRAQKGLDKKQEADELARHFKAQEKAIKVEKQEAEKGLWDTYFSQDAIDSIMDPSKKEREEEEKLKKEVRASKRQWRKIRAERFAFLDADAPKQ